MEWVIASIMAAVGCLAFFLLIKLDSYSRKKNTEIMRRNHVIEKYRYADLCRRCLEECIDTCSIDDWVRERTRNYPGFVTINHYISCYLDNQDQETEYKLLSNMMDEAAKDLLQIRKNRIERLKEEIKYYSYKLPRPGFLIGELDDLEEKYKKKDLYRDNDYFEFDKEFRKIKARLESYDWYKPGELDKYAYLYEDFPWKYKVIRIKDTENK